MSLGFMTGGNRSDIFEGMSDDVKIEDPDFATTWEGMEEPMGDDWSVGEYSEPEMSSTPRVEPASHARPSRSRERAFLSEIAELRSRNMRLEDELARALQQLEELKDEKAQLLRHVTTLGVALRATQMLISRDQLKAQKAPSVSSMTGGSQVTFDGLVE